MRAHILGTGLVLGLAAAACAGPVASAAGEEPYLAAPGEPLAPGHELRIQGHCADPAAGALTSEGLTSIQIRHDPAAGPPNLNASGVVAEDTAPGETVTVQARCDNTGDSVLRSPVLRAVTLAPDPEGHQPWAIHGTTTVTEDAEPGDYPVSMQCGEGAVETTITVLAGVSRGGGTSNGGADQVSRVPRGAPETGAGPPDTSVPLLAVVLALGMAAGAGAIAWRAVR